MSKNDSSSDGSLDKIMPQSAVDIPTGVGPHLTHGKDPAGTQRMVPRPPRTTRGGGSSLVGADGSLEHLMPDSAVEIPSGVAECATASGMPAVETSGGVFAVPPRN